ncbi:MAG TPA: hypothetical protein VMH92_13950 [Acidocella sp.]|nr:hypothetical protein [Acidocella sp.]
MDQRHHQKAKSVFEFPAGALDPEQFIHQWQARAAGLVHAQERIAQGMAAAMRAQIRYGQEFMVSHMKMMQWEVTDAEHLSAQARQDIENFAALVKEVSGEIRSGFAEAGKMLEAKPAHQKQAVPDAPEAEAPEPVDETRVEAQAMDAQPAPPPARAAALAPKPAPARAAPAQVKNTTMHARPRH